MREAVHAQAWASWMRGRWGSVGEGPEIGTGAYIPGDVTGAARRLYLVEEKRVGNVSQQVKDSEAVGGRTKSTCHPSQDPSYSL